MSPEILEFLAPVVGVTSLGIIILIGMKMRYTHLQRTRVSGSAQQEVERLADAVDNLRAEVGLLNERVEFTERLLERPKTARADSDVLPGQLN